MGKKIWRAILLFYGISALLACGLVSFYLIYREIDYKTCIDKMARDYKVNPSYGDVYDALFDRVSSSLTSGMDQTEVELAILTIAPAHFHRLGYLPDGGYAVDANLETCRLPANSMLILLYYDKNGLLEEIRKALVS